ncbi:MAG: cytochrome c biogenesis protein CcsA, partial [Candidatus Hydrogenedentes bacterium]|nr:cytochrome c biogenesis protein CcsA [Candidatus Hydrogenedentota bacterium]
AMRFLENAENISSDSSALALLPPPAGADESWYTPAEMLGLALNEGKLPEAQLGILKTLGVLEQQKNDRTAFQVSIQAMQQNLQALASARDEYAKISTEVLLYKTQPFYNSLMLYTFAFILVAITWLFPQRRLLAWLTLLFLLVPLTLHLYGITLRCIIRERPPVTTLYETIIFISAVAVLVSVIIEFMNRRRIGLSVAPILGALGLFLANKYEMIDGRDTMPNLIAVLDTNFWLSTHVTTVTIGYSAGLLAAAIAHVFILGRAVGFRRGDKAFYNSVTRMTYGVLCFCLLFATLGTVLGGIWANESWGRFWGWDPKENGALMIVLWGLAVLHARMGGYIRDFGVNMAAVFGGIIVAFSWFGVNLLGVGLHSYGFTSGIHQALMTFYGIESLVLLLGTAVLMRVKVL